MSSVWLLVSVPRTADRAEQSTTHLFPAFCRFFGLEWKGKRAGSLLGLSLMPIARDHGRSLSAGATTHRRRQGDLFSPWTP